MGKPMKTNLKLIRDRLLWIMAIMFILLNLALFFVSRKFAYIPLIMTPIWILSTVKWSRGACGWACPRAAFLEKVWSFVSLKRPVPAFMRSTWFNVSVFVILVSRIIYVGFTQGLLAAGLMLCVVPTIIALTVGFYSPKAWCAFCPTGSLLKVVDRGILRVKKNNNCSECGICDKACLMGISISKLPEQQVLNSPYCTQCERCVMECPNGSLELTTNNHTEKHVVDIAG